MSASDRRRAISLPNIEIVLSRPSEPGNIGATCRAIKNFGITRLTIVSPSGYDEEAARRRAVGAAELLDSMRRVDSLEAAISGSALVAGVTRRAGQKRKQAGFSPWQFAEQALSVDGSVSVIFGNEQSGLSDAELERCHLAVMIPTSPDFPSLNLSHAVALVAYELGKAALAGAGRVLRTPIAHADLERVTDEVIQSLNEIGFYTQEGPQGMRTFLRELFGRAGLSAGEARRVAGLFHKVRGIAGTSTADSSRSGASP